ncbi:MAG TPA: PxKF domain-containing protein [Actinotalea sp.]|jgi:hypothetical protein
MTRTPHLTRRPRLLTALVVAGLVAATAGAAQADQIVNNLDGTIDAVAEAMPLNVGGPNGATTLRVFTTGDDGKAGCNLTGQTTLTVSLVSSNPAVATVSPSTLTFTSCGFTGNVTVTPLTAGTATISASQTQNNTGGTFDFRPATFLVTVVAPAPSNTAPTLLIAGVASGASYAKGAVPAATCQVSDAEDGPHSFAATLSAVTGPLAADGLGDQTASCSYTDAGGLTVASSVTYSIVDTSAPVITFTTTPTSPDGLSGWYTSDVTLAWHVTEPESPSSLQRTGCVDQTITADQQATSYSCSATSAGGSTEPVTVTVKRDATAPVVTGQVVSTPFVVGSTTWYADHATVEFSATDATSGVLAGSLSPLSTVLGEGFGQSVSASASDVAGTVGHGSVAGINVDATDPVVTATITSTPAWSDWFKDSVDVTASAVDADLADGHAGSGIASADADGGTYYATGSYTATATDNVGHTATPATVSYKVDAAAPTVALTCPSTPVLLGAPASAGWTAADDAAGSGLASASAGSVALDTTSVGSKVASAPLASDNVGHTSAAATCSYSVVYDFTGFFRPIDNGGVFNVVKAGSAVPVKFSLAGNQGLGILAAGSPKVTAIACPASATLDALEEVSAATTSGLKFDAVADQYNYTWKTASTFAGTCKMLTVTLIDGTSKTALFKFTK